MRCRYSPHRDLFSERIPIHYKRVELNRKVAEHNSCPYEYKLSVETPNCTNMVSIKHHLVRKCHGLEEKLKDTKGVIIIRKSKIPKESSESVNLRYQGGNQNP